ncbi:hypothetical protein LJR039_007229 [Pseudorhodoferax sp. LjRoot39]|uniref:hypothetical protein n=1 Tax=Pseudorhodoferax sp. LjRoot39 TaxID=3342328 RepID=UPI003ECE2C18
MQDDSITNDRGGAQDQYGQDDRQRVLRAQQEAQEREQLEQDEADERGRHRSPGARPAAGHVLPQSGPRAATAPGAQQGSRGRVFLLGIAVVAALAFAGCRYTRSAGTPKAAAAASESPLTAGLPPVADEAPRVEPAGPALPSEPTVAAQPVSAEDGNVLGQVPPAGRPQRTGTEAEPNTGGAGQPPETAGADPALQQRLQTVEALVQELREQLARLEGQQSAFAVTAARLTAQRSAPRARPAPRPVASAPAAPEPAAPKLTGRLLAVDSWGGVPSVIVGTGQPGDKRTRVMRPGDSYNGISLLEASRARGEATFMADGKPFKLTLQDGE